MQVGSLKIENGIVLAPLAGITNLPFRLLAKRTGCGLVCSEMISANGLIHRSPKTMNMLASETAEKPLSVQLFGSDPAIMADAASMVEASGADILDINFGCSVKKIVKTGAGVALMREPELAEDIITAVRRSIRIPLTIKIRSGWSASAEQATQIAEIAEHCGVDAIAIHPRTASQGFRGISNWEVIARLKNQLKIPVVGNGDIRLAEDAEKMKAQTGCDAVMVGRRAIGFPWIFSQIKDLFDGRQPREPGLSERFDWMEDYARISVKVMGEELACRLLRSRLCWFVKGLPHNAKFRESITTLQTESEAIEKIRSFKQKLLSRTQKPV